MAQKEEYSEDQIRGILGADPGNAVFVDFADALRDSGRSDEALKVCLSGLNANPSNHSGRLLLARIFFELGNLTFAVREIKELCVALPECKSLKRLLELLAPGEGAESDSGEEEMVAETEFDFEEIDLMEQEEEDTPKES